MEGTIKRKDSQKGYGFITPKDGGKDLFFHSTGVADNMFDSLEEGANVTFEKGDSPKGPKATDVRMV